MRLSRRSAGTGAACMNEIRHSFRTQTEMPIDRGIYEARSPLEKAEKEAERALKAQFIIDAIEQLD